MTSRYQVIPAAYVLLTDQHQRVLLAYRRGTGYMDEHWAAGAAGHVEADESIHAAAVREAHEELGVRIRAQHLMPLTVLHRSAGNGQSIDERIDIFFAVRTWTGTPAIQEPHKAADLGWFGLDDLPEPVVPHEHYVLTELGRGSLPAVTSLGFPPVD